MHPKISNKIHVAFYHGVYCGHWVTEESANLATKWLDADTDIIEMSFADVHAELASLEERAKAFSEVPAINTPADFFDTLALIDANKTSNYNCANGAYIMSCKIESRWTFNKHKITYTAQREVTNSGYIYHITFESIEGRGIWVLEQNGNHSAIISKLWIPYSKQACWVHDGVNCLVYYHETPAVCEMLLQELYNVGLQWTDIDINQN